MKRLKFLIKDLLSYDDGWRSCPICKGTGIVSTATEEFDKDVPMMIALCDSCGGTGQYYIPTHQEMG